MKWALGGFLALVLVLVGGITAYALHFSDRALPGATVAGQSVTGMTQSEIVQNINERADETRVNVTLGTKNSVATLEDLGVTVDAQETAQGVLANNASVMDRFTQAFTKTEVPVSYSVDTERQAALIQDLAGSFPDPVDAEVTLVDTGDSFTVTPATEGVGADIEALGVAANLAATTLQSADVEIDTVDLVPAVTTEVAQRAADDANAILALDISVNGTQSHNPASVEDKATWVVVRQEEGTLHVDIDPTKVTDWVVETADATNDAPVSGIQNVNAEGEVLSVSREGIAGYTANNAQEVATQLVAALEAREDFAGQLEYDKVEPTFEQKEVLPQTANLAYQATKGEKWIDINLTNYTTTAYEGATPVYGPVAIVVGTDQTPTVTGTYKTYLQYPKQTMRGLNVDGSRYETPDVPWVTYFHKGYALHGAYWRSTFGHGGPGGSHGCVNMPIPASKWFYDWAGIGTTVVSHY
mgnify:CR=1 FL=1